MDGYLKTTRGYCVEDIPICPCHYDVIFCALSLCLRTSRCSRSTCSGTVGCPWGRSRRTAGPPAPGTYSPTSGAGPTAPSSGEREEEDG